MIKQKDFRNYVDRLYQIDSEYDATQTDRLARHRHLEPESAQFLASLVIGKNAQNILEIGTSTGYSTLWLAYALQQIHNQNAQNANNPTAHLAKLTSIELDDKRLLTARNHLRTLQLETGVTLQQADAKNFLGQTTEQFDMIFLDAERQFYNDYIADLKRILPFGGVLVVDNVVSHADDVVDFLAQFQDDDNLLCSTLPIGAGLFLAVKI